uniref:Uncharacterized protein n=1 Tax=Rhizophagus irregularis (strain DAOM 181602 / DAOM 197198 / MUCL 43194) TaxID=747089 RepID=U9UM37_RHIID
MEYRIYNTKNLIEKNSVNNSYKLTTQIPPPFISLLLIKVYDQCIQQPKKQWHPSSKNS